MNSKQSGNKLENEVKRLLDLASIPYEQENTENGRKSGSVDFKLKNPVAYLECKRFTDNLSVKLDSEDHDIKWSQVIFLFGKHTENAKRKVKNEKDKTIAGFIVQESTDNRLYFIHIQDFIAWWMVSIKKSLNLADVQRIGNEVGNIREIVDRIGDNVDKE